MRFFKKLSDEGSLRIGDSNSLEEWLRSEERTKLEEFLENYQSNVTLNHLLSAVHRSCQGFQNAIGDESVKVGIDVSLPKGNWDDEATITVDISSVDKYYATSKGAYRLNRVNSGESFFYGNLLLLERPETDERSPGSSTDVIKPTLSACDEMGVARITFFAGLQSGGTKWAQLGAIPLYPAHVANQIDDKFKYLQGVLENPEYGPLARVSDGRGTKQEKQLVNTIQKLKNNDELEFTLELIESGIKQMRNGDGSFLAVMANTPLGRYLLSGSGWGGYFDITPNSDNRKLLEAQLR